MLGNRTQRRGIPISLASGQETLSLLPPSVWLLAESTNSNQAQTDRLARPRCVPEARPARSGALELPATRAQRPLMLSMKNMADVCSKPSKSNNKAKRTPKSSAAMICVFRSVKPFKWRGNTSQTAPRLMFLLSQTTHQQMRPPRTVSPSPQLASLKTTTLSSLAG